MGWCVKFELAQLQSQNFETFRIEILISICKCNLRANRETYFDKDEIFITDFIHRVMVAKFMRISQRF